MHQNAFAAGLYHGPHWGSLHRSPSPIAIRTFVVPFAEVV